MSILPLSWEQIHQDNFDGQYFESVRLYHNPSNENEVLMFLRFYLEKTQAYNVVTRSYKTYTLPMWPSTLFQEYYHQRFFNKKSDSCEYDSHSAVGYIVTSGIKPHTLSVIGTIAPESVYVTFYGILNTIEWKFEKINESYHFKFFPNEIIKSRICLGRALTYKHYIFLLGTRSSVGCIIKEMTIFNVEDPNKAIVSKVIPLNKKQFRGVKAIIIRHSANDVKILIFDQQTDTQRSYDESFCEVSINLNTLKYFVNDEPDIKKNLAILAQGSKCENSEKESIISRFTKDFCTYLWYSNRYLILFGEMAKYCNDNPEKVYHPWLGADGCRRIVYYDVKKCIWNKSAYVLPFKLSPQDSVILMRHDDGKKYLHFITSCSHTELEFGEMRLKQQLWKIIRLIWIGYYKNQLIKQKCARGKKLLIGANFMMSLHGNCKQKEVCMFAQLPKDIVKHIVSFLKQDVSLYFDEKIKPKYFSNFLPKFFSI